MSKPAYEQFMEFVNKIKPLKTANQKSRNDQDQIDFFMMFIISRHNCQTIQV